MRRRSPNPDAVRNQRELIKQQVRRYTTPWFVYIVACKDGSLYTGVSNDVVERVRIHNLGNGAKYTRSRLPVRLVYTAKFATHSEALREEARIKKMSRQDKTFLISNTEIMQCQNSRPT